VAAAVAATTVVAVAVRDRTRVAAAAAAVHHSSRPEQAASQISRAYKAVPAASLFPGANDQQNQTMVKIPTAIRTI